MTKTNNAYCLRNVNVRPFVGTKGNIPYLSWPFVVATLKAKDPKSSYSVKQFPEIDLSKDKQTGRKVDYCEGVNGEGSYVTVTATFKGQSHTETLPCYERVPETRVDSNGQVQYVKKYNKYSHKSYTPKILTTRSHPNMTTVNNSIKRCYVKAVAMLTGLGIDLYIDPQNYLRNSRQQRPGLHRQAPVKPRVKKISSTQVNSLNKLIKETAKATGASLHGKAGLIPFVASNYANSYKLKDMPERNYAKVKEFLEGHIMSVKNAKSSTTKSKATTK